jgi:hypothetical protein
MMAMQLKYIFPEGNEVLKANIYAKRDKSMSDHIIILK